MDQDITSADFYRYFLLTFVISWALWSPFYFSSNVNEFWVLLGAWGPTIAALILTYRKKGKKGIRKLLKKILIWKVKFKYYLFAIFGILSIGIITVFVHKAFSGNYPNWNVILEGMGLGKGQVVLAIALSPLFFLINTIFGGPIAEELGWRGYAQRILQQKYNPNTTGIIIGFLWGVWHLPLIIFLPKATGNMPVFAYILLMIAMGILFSWLYNKTKGSVLLAILLHGGMNFTHGFLGADILSDKTLLFIQVVLIVVTAILLSIQNKKPIAYNT
ncbi:CPBP family intramembrane glutamic endopeptidase [Aquimarina algicola]|uniref:CPBP family intramembrane metalloprotease n=1 Tax=Aquimarina algicola TaxID=2589995 RepID=A0A504J7T7_9FLAO|nr:type II CAAX endopeptidase family protein [Aquimarina algicola]TPN86926.1 CPBP family intramembrane metalloprotease [Aquimarina algicola]